MTEDQRSWTIFLCFATFVILLWVGVAVGVDHEPERYYIKVDGTDGIAIHGVWADRRFSADKMTGAFTNFKDANDALQTLERGRTK